MKVTDDSQVKSLVNQPQVTKKITTQVKFTDTLAGSMKNDRTDQAKNVSPTVLPPVDQVISAAQVISGKKMEPLDNVDNTLNLLDNFAAALADPTKSLKQVSEIVDDLDEAAQKLKSMNQSLPEQHQGRELVERTAILAAVESAKFRRGDYI